MVHPYNRIASGQPDVQRVMSNTDKAIKLSPTEEHYLKKLLIKNEIITELNSLSPEYGDTSGLRRFGPPFIPANPRTIVESVDSATIDQLYEIGELSIDVFRGQFPMLRFIFETYIVTFPFIKIHLKKLGNTMRDQMSFWIKIQTLFELFKSKRISNSNDRGTTSKRNLLLYKVRAVLVSFFNSSIYAKQDPEYFAFDKERRGAYKKLSKFIDNKESDGLANARESDDKLTYLELNLSDSELINYLNDIDDLEYVNGWYVNIIDVTVAKEMKTSFWGAKESKFFSFIIQVKRQGEEKSWFIKKRYTQFSKFHQELKHMHPGVKVPDLPSKDKHAVQFDLEDKTIKENIQQFEDAEMTDLGGMDKDSVDALFSSPPTIESNSSPMSPSSSSSRSFLKSPKLFIKTPTLGKKDKGTFLSPLMNSHKRTSSSNSLDSELSVDSDDSDETFHSAHSGTDAKHTHRFPREVLRQSLRAYLRFIVNNKDLACSVELKTFLTTTKVAVNELDCYEIQRRLNLDNMKLVQHYKFQKALVGTVKILEKDVELLKGKIYESGFNYVFDRICENESLHQLCGFTDGNMSWLYSDTTNEPTESSPLRGLVRIIMLEIASTQYELLIGSDSSMATLKTIKKLHYMFPYRIVAGVLRFTNPLMMVKRMIDVFTYQMPTVSGGINGMMQGLGMNGWKKDEKTSKNKSLLQLLFSGMLGDDLKKIEKEKIEVFDGLNNLQDGDKIMNYIDKYFEMNDDDVIAIKKMSEEESTEIFIAVLQYFQLNPKTLTVLEDDHAKSKAQEELNKEGLYLLVKRYFHLQLRKNDKEMMIELWNEPELMNVIKEIISLFLSPLIELFKKADVYKYVPIFAKYMSELLSVCGKYSNDYGEYGRSDIVSDLVGLEEKYSEYLYKFVRDIYLNDIEDENSKLFESIIEWMNRVVKFISFVKKGRPDLKIDMMDIFQSLSDDEKDHLMELVEEMIKAGEKKKQLMEQMEEEGGTAADSSEHHQDWTKVERDRKVDQAWDDVHNRVWDIGAALMPSDSEDVLLDNVSIVTADSIPAIAARTGDIQALPPGAVKMFRAKLRTLFAEFADAEA